MNHTKNIIGFRQMSNGKKTILVTVLVIWAFALVGLFLFFTELGSENPSRKYAIIVGFGFILITGILNSLYKRFRIN